MVTLPSLLFTAVVLTALALMLGASLYWRDNKTKVNRAIGRVFIFLARLCALPFASLGYLSFLLIYVVSGLLLLWVRIMTGRYPSAVSVKISFDE